MREQNDNAVRFLYRAVVWVDAYRLRVFSASTVAAATAYWLTGSAFLELVALTSLITVLVNLGREAVSRWGRGRAGS